jgi:hypothetical protein
MKTEAGSNDKLTSPVYFEKYKYCRKESESTGVSERTIIRILKKLENTKNKTLHLKRLAGNTTSLGE